VTGAIAGTIEPGGLTGELPEILPVVEDFRRVHVIGAVKLGLDEEEVLRVADVLLQIRWHGLERLEQPRENAPVGCDHWIGWVRYIKVHRPVVGVDDDLHRISNVIRSSTRKGLGIGEPLTRSVSVLHPEEPPVADD